MHFGVSAPSSPFGQSRVETTQVENEQRFVWIIWAIWMSKECIRLDYLDWSCNFQTNTLMCIYIYMYMYMLNPPVIKHGWLENPL